QLHALRPISDELHGGPAGGGETAAEVGDGVVGNLDVEGTDLGGGVGHGAGHCASSRVRRSRSPQNGRAWTGKTLKDALSVGPTGRSIALMPPAAPPPLDSP